MSSSEQYSDEEMLQLSGIQHYVFCSRQWALIHIEQIWSDNSLTVEGSLLHKNVDNPFLREKSHDEIITLRGLQLSSYKLGFSGIADAVEIYPLPNAPKTKKDILDSKMFKALPIEYKRGKPKVSDCDRMQVAAQACILEDMLGVEINQGAIFYWETRHREYFDITSEMRQNIERYSKEMHDTLALNLIPKATKKPYCRNCSLLDYCLPSLTGRSAEQYLNNSLLS